jgi:hypothetical protein
MANGAALSASSITAVNVAAFGMTSTPNLLD